MAIHTLVFDLGGVVLPHTKKITPQLLGATFGIPKKTAESVYSTLREAWRSGNLSSYQVLSRIKKEIHSPRTVAELSLLYRDMYLDHAQIDHGLLDVISRLKRLYTIVAMSNSVDIHHHINLKRGLMDHFHRVYMSYQIGHIKPDKRAFIHVIGDLKTHPTEMLFIDDRLENIHAAAELGLHTHHYRGRLQFLDHLTERNLL